MSIVLLRVFQLAWGPTTQWKNDSGDDGRRHERDVGDASDVVLE